MAFDGNILSTAEIGTLTLGVFTDTFSIAGADVDMVRFTFQAGHEYRIDEDNLASGDLCMRIFDARGHEVNFNDDGSFSNDDVVLATSPFTVFRPNYTGVYYVALSSTFLRNYDPTTTAGRLAPENPSASFSGELSVTDLGDSLDWAGANAIGVSGITAEGINDETNVLRGDDRAGRRVEYQGTIEFATDVDIGRVDLRKGDWVVVDVTGLTGNGTVLRIFNSAGTQIGFDSGSGTAGDAELSFVAPTTSTYYIGVSATGNTAYNAIDGTGAVAGVFGDYSVVFHVNPTQIGSNSSNFFTGNSGENYIVSLSANDTINAGAGNDTLAGGDDNDSLTGGDGEDDLYGEHGNDTMDGGAGADVLVGGIGNDSLSGGDGDDILDGSGGADTLIGSAGSDTLSGGDGDDFIYYDAADTAANVTGGNNFDILNVVGGSAPTAFNLAAQGFEQAFHQQTDSTNQVWSSIRDIYGSNWARIQSNIFLDDGTRQDRNFDHAANQPYSEYIDYYLDVASPNSVTRQVIFEDAGTKQERFFDYNNTQPAYSEYINFYTDLAMPNRVTRQVGFADGGGVAWEYFF